MLCAWTQYARISALNGRFAMESRVIIITSEGRVSRSTDTRAALDRTLPVTANNVRFGRERAA
jgi:hypothetical protein